MVVVGMGSRWLLVVGIGKGRRGKRRACEGRSFGIFSLLPLVSFSFLASVSLSPLLPLRLIFCPVTPYARPVDILLALSNNCQVVSLCTSWLALESGFSL